VRMLGCSQAFGPSALTLGSSCQTIRSESPTFRRVDLSKSMARRQFYPCGVCAALRRTKSTSIRPPRGIRSRKLDTEYGSHAQVNEFWSCECPGRNSFTRIDKRCLTRVLIDRPSVTVLGLISRLSCCGNRWFRKCTCAPRSARQCPLCRGSRDLVRRTKVIEADSRSAAPPAHKPQ